MFKYVRVGLATGLWTLAVILLAVRSVDYNDMRLSVLTGWAMLVGLAASVVTGWCLLVHERDRIRDIAEIVASECHQQLRSVE